MFDIFAQLCGGIGLFLLGMSLMTDSLKEIAGESLRLWLARFTGSPIRAMNSGIIFTLIVQSSTATTLATIGFVSAGVLTFAQAIGVVIGANIGTTSTGWLVALLGVKFSIGVIALPIIALGALAKILTQGRIGLFGLVLAGFGLIFYGIELLQIAMSGLSDQIDLSILKTETWSDKLLLVLLGIAMTLILQSSSAAITATIAALATQVIQLEQALLLVIGQNVGTVATAVLATIGANASAKRTAAVHVIFNIVSAVFAFWILCPLFVWLYQTQFVLSEIEPVLIVAAFHTAFSLLGAAMFLPMIEPLKTLLSRLFPANEDHLLQRLDSVSLSVPALALAAAENVLFELIWQQQNWIRSSIKTGVYLTSNQLKNHEESIIKLQEYLSKIEVSEDHLLYPRLFNLLRALVYLKVFRSDLEQLTLMQSIRMQPMLYQMALDYSNILDQYWNDLGDIKSFNQNHALFDELQNLKKWTKERRIELRENIQNYAQDHHLSAAKTLELLAAHRWLDRIIAHHHRFMRVLVDAQIVEVEEVVDVHA